MKGSLRWLIAVLVLVVVGGVSGSVWYSVRRKANAPPGTMPTGASLTDTSAHAPQGQRVVVRVLNSSGLSGRARLATSVLRDFGYDVVDYGTGPDTALAASRVEVHTGRTDWADRVLKVLGTGTVTTVTDSSRFVDLTVIIGRDWQPPSDPFRP